MRKINEKTNCTILIVEDNPADVHLVREALSEHRVDCALVHIKDGEQALQFIDDVVIREARYPDLVILDLNLPRKSGAVILEHLRGCERFSLVPVVILTSSDNQRDRDATARLGASAYVRKPTALAEFLELGSLFKHMLNARAAEAT